MRILIPILSFNKSGGTRVLSQLANYFTTFGHEVTMVTHNASMNPYFPLNNKVKVKFINYYGDVSDFEENRMKYGILRIIALKNYIKLNNKKYDVVIANAYPTAYIALFGKKIKKFYYIQAYEADFHKGIYHRLLARFSYDLPLKQVVNSHLYLKYKNIRSKNVVYPGLDLKNYYPKKYKEFSNKIIIGTVGRFEEWKGTKDVIKAFKLLKKIISDNKKIELRIAYNKLEDKTDGITCVVPHNDKELADYYRSVDIMVAPGHIQLGAVHYPVIESMACGTPIITTGYYPADDKRNAWIVPIKSPEKIAECIMYMVENQDLVFQKVQKAIQDVQQFDWNIVAEKFIEIIEES